MIGRRALPFVLTPTAVLAVLGSASPTRQEPPDSAEPVVGKVCSGCHAVPPPDALPRSAWPAVVADMAALIAGGVGTPKGAPPPSIDFDIERVLRHYESKAPSALPTPPPWPAPEAAPRFAVHPLAPVEAAGSPAVANVHFARLEGAPGMALLAADMVAGRVWGAVPVKPASSLRGLGSVPNPCHIEAIDLDRDGRTDLLIADLGDAAPSDNLKGSIVWLRRVSAEAFTGVTLARGLPRIADVQAADFDGDGDMDLVVAAFGWREAGGILFFENRTEDWRAPSFVKRELDDRKGAIHVPIRDLDRDGRLDFVALLSQQHEKVVAFLGDGNGGFRRETIDEAPHPAWGSSGLEVVDFDEDGDLDVLVTNGDMLDDFRLKPYHGIRWLENRGGYPFVPHDLASLPGVHRARAVDLDGDGDNDVVACAFVQFSEGGLPRALPDLPSLVWLEQTAKGAFERHTLERGMQHVSLDVADFDADGDLDIAVGNFRSSGTKSSVDLWENLGTKR